MYSRNTYYNGCFYQNSQTKNVLRETFAKKYIKKDVCQKIS